MYRNSSSTTSLVFCIVCLCNIFELRIVSGLGCNWGIQATHPLPPEIAVKLLKDNGFNKVKLFEADGGALKALGRSGIEVMVGIPNDLLASLASTVTFAETWVQQNISKYISIHGTDIRYVAVGNEPFLQTYKDTFLNTTFPALQNIQAALIKAGLGKQVKVTVPLNADVYQTDNGLPSGGDFRPDIRDLMLSIIKFLANNRAPLTFNIYPFLSLNADPNFPKDYAFFNGSTANVVDGSITYTNVFEANFDTLLTALEKNGFGSDIDIIIGEVGWPTDGDPNANVVNAQRFNQGLLERIRKRQGTPKKDIASEIYMFSLIDEDRKSIDPGNFERHWGIFNYDGSVKYALDMGNGKGLVAAKGVKYLEKRWCVMAPRTSPTDVGDAVGYACQYADCTSLGYGSSCGNLDAVKNASYAFNMYYQTMDQKKGRCNFNNSTMLTNINPSQDGCRFQIQMDVSKHERSTSEAGKYLHSCIVDLLALVGFLFLFFSS